MSNSPPNDNEGTGKKQGTDEQPGAGQSGGNKPGGADFLPPQFREFAQKAVELANNPVARTMFAAGLVTAAAALTANKKVRENARKAGREAMDTAEEAAETASRMGTAMATAASDAFRKMMNIDEGGAGEKAETSDNQGPRQEPPAAESAEKSSANAGTKPAAMSGADAKPARPKASTKSAQGKAASTGTTTSGSGRKAGEKPSSPDKK